MREAKLSVAFGALLATTFLLGKSALFASFADLLQDACISFHLAET